MLLTSSNLSQIKYKTKRVSLKKADIEIMVALLPASVTKESVRLKREKDDLLDGLSDEEKQQALESWSGTESLKNLGFEIIKNGCVDEKGEPVFQSIEDFENLPGAVQLEIQEAIFDFNGLSVKSQKQIEKN